MSQNINETTRHSKFRYISLNFVMYDMRIFVFLKFHFTHPSNMQSLFIRCIQIYSNQ